MSTEVTTEFPQEDQKKYGSLTQGLAITGLIIGIVTLLVSFIPCFGLFAPIFGAVAVFISVIALAIALKHGHSKGLIIGALITALLGCTIAYTQYAAMKGIAKLGTEAQQKIEEQNNQ